MTIYRKYRPQKFKELVGQEAIKKTIQNEIKTGKIAHAYLFSGLRGIGKTTMARLLAKAVNCSNRKKGEFEPCNKCQSCQEISRGNSLDLVEIDAASNRGINEIRALKEHVRISPSKSTFKIFIIDEAHMLTTEAFNALLKTLEEPPKHIIFILATTEIHKLPETIISRCQRFDFQKIIIPCLISRLNWLASKEGVKITSEVIESIAQRAEGSSRDAESILGQIISLGEKEITWQEASSILPRSDSALIKKLLTCLLNSELKQAVDIINQAKDDGVNLERFFLDIIEYLREQMILSISENAGLELEVSTQKISLMIDVFIKRFEDFKKMIELPQLALEMAVVEISLTASQPDSLTARQPHSITASQPDSLTASQPHSQTASPNGNIKVKANNKKESFGNDNVLFEQIESKWPQVLEEIKKHNHSLPVALNVCRPLGLENGFLSLGFKYNLHCQVVKNYKNKTILENVLSSIYKNKILVKTEIREDIEIENKENKQEYHISEGKASIAAEQMGVDEAVKEVFGDLVENNQ